MPCKLPISTVPPIVRACGTKAGGIPALVFMKKRFVPGDPPLDLCAKPVADLCSIEQWQQATELCYVRIVNKLRGERGETTFADRRSPYLCQTPIFSDGLKSLVFKDFSYSNSGLDIDFWNCLMTFPHKFRFGYMNCAGDFFGFSNFVLRISSVVEDSFQGRTYFSGSLGYAGWALEKPLTIPNGVVDYLLAYQNYDCASGQFLQDFENVCA